ncbi:hypothetical protein [Shewanella carassii]|uniref:hypothetical protein n=1 Tax=Shewanella carassii TaxID=1987584 RepID=UPI001C80A8CC|nr:hypothetical protein [Shewanella carassii]
MPDKEAHLPARGLPETGAIILGYFAISMTEVAVKQEKTRGIDNFLFGITLRNYFFTVVGLILGQSQQQVISVTRAPSLLLVLKSAFEYWCGIICLQSALIN